jgi:hypothetical protein
MADGRRREESKVGGRVNTARVQLVKNQNDFQRRGTLDSNPAHRELHFKHKIS